MNRARVKNPLLNTASVSASLTVTEPVPITLGNLNHSIYRNRSRCLYEMPVTIIATETMPVTPDSS